MTWLGCIAAIYSVGFVTTLALNSALVIATGAMITPGLALFRAITWPFFWTRWWRGEPVPRQMD